MKVSWRDYLQGMQHIMYKRRVQAKSKFTLTDSRSGVSQSATKSRGAIHHTLVARASFGKTPSTGCALLEAKGC
jgi:hypothetical protein